MPVAASSSAVILADDSDESTPTAMGFVAASSSARSTVALGEMFAPHASKPIRHRHVSKARHDATDDSDVDLLTALIKHVEVAGPLPRHRVKSLRKHASASAKGLEDRIQACPAANTEAGVNCRQRICHGHAGEAVTCPAAMPDGA